MKDTQRERYARGIERVVSHLATLDPEAPLPGLEALAAIAHLSPFHFHRVYRLMAGETPAETAQRLRLARAVPRLDARDSVTAAAGAAGYATSAAYARALKRRTGVTASEAIGSEQARRAMAERLRRPARPEGADAIEIQVRSFEPFEVVALRNLGPWEALNGAYTRLFEAVTARVPPERITGIWGVPLDDPASVPPASCRFECALAVEDLASMASGSGLERLRLGGMKVAAAVHRGAYEGVGRTLDAITLAAVDRLDRALGEQAPFVHYRHDPEETAEADLEALVCVPLA